MSQNSVRNGRVRMSLDDGPTKVAAPADHALRKALPLHLLPFPLIYILFVFELFCAGY